MERSEFDAIYDAMVAEFKQYGFNHVCYQAKSGDGTFTETWANEEGIFVELNPVENRFSLSVIDGMIECRIRDLGFPNPHTPHFIRQLRRHLPENAL